MAPLKTVRRFLLAALAIVVAVPLIMLAELWMSADAAISDAQRAHLLDASSKDAPLTTVERTIAIIEFGGAWNARPAPCRSLDGLWRTIAGGGRRVRVYSTVSEALSRTVLRDQEMGGLRWHFMGVLVACQLDQHYSDTEMLRAWLSNAYFGQRPYGVEHAARSLFGKSAAELNLEESSRLAALLKGPSNYLNHPERWAERARFVRERVAAYQGPLVVH